MSGLADLVATRRLLVCVGPGGVGKTTLAAALALGAARRGRHTLVLTVDPARRLADALGVGTLGNEPTPLPRATLAQLGVPEHVAFSALMLDPKRTFDELVERHTRDAATRARILDNPIYKHVSDALAGSAEYAAIEKVYAMSERDEFDLIVVDTPPATHTLDLLSAPERLLGLFSSALVQRLVHPALQAGRFGWRVFQRGIHQAFQLVERVTGFGFLEDVSEFLLAIEGVAQGMQVRARDASRLLLSERTGFVLACAPQPASLAQAERLLSRLALRGADVVAVVANRVRVWPEPPPLALSASERPLAETALAAALAARQPASYPAHAAAQAALAMLDGYAANVERDQRALESLFVKTRSCGAPICVVPEIAGDISDLSALAHVERALFDTRDG